MPNQPTASAIPYNPYKNPTNAVLIAAIGGLFGFSGIGHMYVGKVVKGIVILVGGLVLFVLGFFTIGVTFVLYFILWIWQIFDARKLANQFNESLQNSGKQPW